MELGETENGARSRELHAIYVSVELSRKTWLVTSLSPGAGEKLSRHMVPGGDIGALLERLSKLRSRALERTGSTHPVIVIQEAGLDGFWVHRVLEAEGHESHVVDAASIATSRRRRRVKTDRLDGETLIRALLAFKRGEPRVCSMVYVPTPAEEDRRRIVRERKVLMQERIQHSNRIKGLLFSQGITGYDPTKRDRRERLAALRTGDGRELPAHMKHQIERELDRLELVLDQVRRVEAERDAMLAEERRSSREVEMLSNVVGIGREFAAVLWGEGLFRRFACGATDRAIARSIGVARSTIALYMERTAAAGLSWPLPDTLTDRVLEAMLFASTGTKPGCRRKGEPDWAHVHRELRRPGVTLTLLWEEYRAAEPGAYQYSRWCELYRDWESRLSPTMRQAHPAGERLFVDYAGQTVEVVDAKTGEITLAQIFVAVLGASNYTYAEATATQALPDWIGSHGRALAFLGGVPRQIVPDNPKVGVTKALWYEPGLNRTYLDLAAHYGTAILPTRTRKPRDKAKVEAGVLVVERWILARLRNRRFFSLAELNAAIAELVADLNARPMKRLGVSRAEMFTELDRPALKPLPAEPFVYAEWRVWRVSLDYHVDIDGHYYSVPFRLIKEQVDARITARTIEIFHKGERVAVHVRGGHRGRHTTVPEHMPNSHRRYAEWTIERIRREAAAVGPSTGKLAALILESKPHPEQGFRACLGIIRLARQYGRDRLEAACDRGLGIGARSYGSIHSILQNGLDRARTSPRSAQGALPLDHPNIRGSGYYQ